MSFLESFRKKPAPPAERIEPQPPSAERASANETADAHEPQLTMPEPNFAHDAFAQGPETAEQEAERHLLRIATECGMTPEDLLSLETYTVPAKVDGHMIEMGGIRGQQNGLAVDVRQQWNETQRANEIVATIGDRTFYGDRAREEDKRLRRAYSRKVTWQGGVKSRIDSDALAQARGLN